MECTCDAAAMQAMLTQIFDFLFVCAHVYSFYHGFNSGSLR